MHAFGQPGIPPTWTSSAKDMVGTTIGAPRLWFTAGRGIVNEVYYPRIDIPQIRDLGFIVADGAGFWVEVKRLHSYRMELPRAGIPAIRFIHTHPRFELRLRIAPDPLRDALLVEATLESTDARLRPYVLLAPHLGGSGRDNLAEVRNHRGRCVLWAQQGPFGLALAAVDAEQRDALGAASAGYVGRSDGWQDFARHGAHTWRFDEAGPGNVALIGALGRHSTLSLAFGTTKESAATLAYASLASPFEQAWRRHVDEWLAWHAQLVLPVDLPPTLVDQVRTSAMVLRVHQDKTYPGAMVASLSVPWGNTRDDTGGYHLVWPRDLVECAGGLLALGATGEARDILRHLIATQRRDGHWPQNMWLGGTSYWHGVQLDETGFPVLLAAALAELDALDGIEARDMVTRALGHIARNGPCSDQDRWEEDAGINPFTLAVCIAALVSGAALLDDPARTFALSLADYWNARIEDWCCVRGTALDARSGTVGHYVRIAPNVSSMARFDTVLPIRNRAADPGVPARDQIGTDFLQLVRLGLRDARDTMVQASVRLVDLGLKIHTPFGPCWHRYTGDGYGEHADGAPFDGVGTGRGWPLLTGERGHFVVAAGEDPLPYLQAMAAMTGLGGLIPEQVWDAPSINARRLHPGRPSGSAMPLVWAHAEFVKLATSRALGRPFDSLHALRERYGGKRPTAARAFWNLRCPIDAIASGQMLAICIDEPVTVHWGIDGWTHIEDTKSQDSGLGAHCAELSCGHLQRGQRIDFTFRRERSQAWCGTDYHVDVA